MRTLVSALLLGAVSAAAQPTFQPGPNGSTVVTIPPFVGNCTATGQTCGVPIDLPLDLFSGARLEVTYTAPAAHCSDVRLHFLLDGTEVGKTPFTSPLGSVHTRIRLHRGAGKLGFDAEGRLGGCNQGTLVSWGGTLEIVVRPNTCVGRLAKTVTVPASGATVVQLLGTVEAAPAGSGIFTPITGSLAIGAAGFQVRIGADSLGEIRTVDGRLYLVAPDATVSAEEGSPLPHTRLVPTLSLDEPVLARIKRFKKGPGAYGVRPCK
jgi:hypothetical protein